MKKFIVALIISVVLGSLIGMQYKYSSETKSVSNLTYLENINVTSFYEIAVSG